MSTKTNRPVVCTLAGSDPTAAAGIQADLKTFAALGVYGTSVITAITAQNSCSLQRISPLSPEIVLAQLDSVAEEFDLRGIKVGMLGSVEIAEAVKPVLQTFRLQGVPVVLDPVLVTSSGTDLQNPEYTRLFFRLLEGMADLVTPNLAEARHLGNFDEMADSRCKMKWQAQQLANHLGCAMLVKGGHLQGKTAVDIFFDGENFKEFSSPFIKTVNSRGTGCTLSSAITAWLARGYGMKAAVYRAKLYVSQCLENAQKNPSGKCGGPLGHLD